MLHAVVEVQHCTSAEVYMSTMMHTGDSLTTGVSLGFLALQQALEGLSGEHECNRIEISWKKT